MILRISLMEDGYLENFYLDRAFRDEYLHTSSKITGIFSDDQIKPYQMFTLKY